jgi:hypothetical protein
MRGWIARKLFMAAYKIEGDDTTTLARLLVMADDMARENVLGMLKPKRKPGRPKGKKDGVGPKTAPKKRGRPLGSKNKPKDPVA